MVRPKSSARPTSPPALNSSSAQTRSGRDLFSRLIYGARNTIGIAFVTTMLSFLIGGTLGVLTALKRGWLDQGISRIVDSFLAIPVLIFCADAARRLRQEHPQPDLISRCSTRRACSASPAPRRSTSS